MGKSSEKRCKYGEMIDLREMEEEVLLEGQEWMRQRLEEKLREKAAAFFPGRHQDDSERPEPESED